MGKKFPCMTGIFGGNEVTILEGFQRPQGYVFEIADGSRDDIKHLYAL